MDTENDRIQRDITIAATAERVCKVLTLPEHVTQWFETAEPIEIDRRPGGEMILHGANGR